MTAPEKPEVSFIVGTEGKPDYMVIAKSGQIVLGVKAVLGMAPFGKTFVGARLRAAGTWKKDEVVSFENVQALPTKASFTKAFPQIEFEKVDDVRASNMIGLLVPRAIYQPQELSQILAEASIGQRIVEWVGERVDPEQFVVEADTFVDWFNGQLLNQLNELLDQIPFPTGHFDPATPVEYMKVLAHKQTAPLNAAKQKMKELGLSVLSGGKTDEDDDGSGGGNGNGNTLH